MRGNNPILTLKPNIFLHISLTSTPMSKYSTTTYPYYPQPPPTPTAPTTPKPTINNGIERSLFILQPYTYSKTSHFPSYLININSRFLSNLHNRVLFYKMIKIRGNNPILTLKANIFLHISSTSTPISFKPS